MLNKSIKRKFKLAALTIGGFLLSSFVTACLLPLLFVFLILSEIVYLFLKLRFGRKACRPHGMDILQGMENEKSRAYINSIGRFENSPDIEIIRRNFKKRIIDAVDENGKKIFRRMTQVFEKYYGYYLFKDVEDFDISKHIYLISEDDFVPRSTTPEGHQGYSEDKWQTYVNLILRKFGARFIEGRPKWEILIFPHAKGHTMLFRVHHSITDGIYFTRCILEVFADKPVNFHPFYNYHQPNTCKRLMDRFWAFCLIPYGVFRLCFSYEKNPLHGPELTGKKEYLLSQRIPLNVLKDVKRKAQVSMSTVLFSCLSYALTCHFKRRNVNISNIIVLIPVGLQDMSKRVTFKNRFALKGTLLPTSIENELLRRDKSKSSVPSSIIRLRQVDANLHKTKKDASFLAIHYLIISLGALLPECLTKVLLTTKGLTTSFSNVAGPQGEDLYYCGNKQEDIAFWVPDRSPMGMGVSVTGWNGNILVGLMADTGLIPTIEEGYEFLKDFTDEINNLFNDLKLTKSSNEICEKSNLLLV